MLEWSDEVALVTWSKLQNRWYVRSSMSWNGLGVEGSGHGLTNGCTKLKMECPKGLKLDMDCPGPQMQDEMSGKVASQPCSRRAIWPVKNVFGIGNAVFPVPHFFTHCVETPPETVGVKPTERALN